MLSLRLINGVRQPSHLPSTHANEVLYRSVLLHECRGSPNAPYQPNENIYVDNQPTPPEYFAVLLFLPDPQSRIDPSLSCPDVYGPCAPQGYQLAVLTLLMLLFPSI